jgi:hypothetical protein
MVSHANNTNYLGDRGKRILRSRPAMEKLAKSYIKNKIKTKQVGPWLKW